MRRSFRLLLVAAALSTSVATAVSTTIASAADHPAAASHSAVFPTVSGQYGQVPKISFPKGLKPPAALESKVLRQGSGPVTKKGDLLVANYVGQIWGGKVFDSSFSRKQLSGFAIGVHQVISGWDKTLVGVHTGTRMLLVIPPVDGYGAGGQSAVGITGKDDLVFVVDLVASYGHTSEAQAGATVLAHGVRGITVSGAPGSPASIKVGKATKKPSVVSLTILSRGHGKPITPGLVVCQLVVSSFTNVVQESTWKLGTPYGANVPVISSLSIFGKLKGVPLGSRVLVELPATASGGGPYALVLDTVAEPADPQR